MQSDLHGKISGNSDSGSGYPKDEGGVDSNFGKDDGGDNSGSEQNTKTKKKYSVITQEVREKFIKRVISREVTIKEAAKEFGIKFSTSKAILQTYKREGRIGKKKTRQRRLSHSEQDRGGDHHNNSPKAQSFKGSNKNGATEDPLKNVQNTNSRQHGATNSVTNTNHLYRSAVSHPVGAGLEISDPSLMDNDLKNTIYEMQATLQDGYPMYDPTVQNSLINSGLLKQNEGLLQHGNFSADSLSQSNKLSGVGGSLFGSGLSANPLLGSQVSGANQAGSAQIPSLLGNYPFQFGAQHPGQSLYPSMYNPYAFAQQGAFSGFSPYYYPQVGQPNAMLFQMQQQQLNAASQQAQKGPRRVAYPNPFNSNQASTLTDSQGPSIAQIREQIKGVNTDQLRANAAQFQNKEFERENEYNYQKYYHQ